jgi:protein-S-isoprenylcysteine O-methyltransferase Ste14
MNLKRISVRQILVYIVSVGTLCLARPIWPTFLAGCGFAALGIALRIWGCGHLRKNRQLTTSGPYARVQHPLYLGTFLVSVGAIIAAGSPCFPSVLLWAVGGPVFLLAFFGYYLPKKKRVEGARLAEIFGAPFVEYAKVVPPFCPALRPYPNASTLSWSKDAFLANHEWGMDVLIAAVFSAMWLVPRLVPWS